MQGSSSSWVPPRGTLGELIEAAAQRSQFASAKLSEVRAAALDTDAPTSFREAMRGDFVRLIAEVKRSSPSKGAIAPQIDATAQAMLYETGGAAAVSVLTEPNRFGGSLEDLRSVSEAVRLPTIRKDFIVHPVQVWEARASGAAAVLLIVRGLSPDALPQLADTANEAGLDALFEVRDEDEMTRALGAGARIIGVNNRNLETLVIDGTRAPMLIPKVPSHMIAVAESGIHAPSDASAAIAAGADALLVGSMLSASPDPVRAVSELTCFARVPR